MRTVRFSGHLGGATQASVRPGMYIPPAHSMLVYTPSPHGQNDRCLWKHNLRKLYLQAVITLGPSYKLLVISSSSFYYVTELFYTAVNDVKEAPRYKWVLIVTRLFNIAINDFDAKKPAGCS